METSTAQTIKLAISELTGLSKDALHIYVGLAVFLVAAAVSPRRFRSIVPLIAVAAVAIAGELVDMHEDLSTLGYWRWVSSLHDMLNTLFWPAVVWLLARSGAMFGQKS